LTVAGQKKMRRSVKGMQALDLKFDAIISSPYMRARQTAEIVAQVYKLKIKTIYLTNNLLPPASIEELLHEVNTHFPKSKNILLVGHEPHLTEMICSLLKCPTPLNIDLKKGGLCALSLQQKDATLNWLLTPLQLVLLAR